MSSDSSNNEASLRGGFFHFAMLYGTIEEIIGNQEIRIMSNYKSPKSIIETYKKRQRRLPVLIGLFSFLLIGGGIVLIVLALGGGNGFSMPSISLFATKTYTPTVTSTATPIPPTATATLTPTVTITVTETVEPTPSGPFEYTVQEGDNCWDIATQFEVDINVLLALNNFGGECPINPGDVIYIPAPDTELPTATPIPDDLPRGTEIEYIVQSGDTLDTIAQKFNSLLSVIMDRNELDDANSIQAGQKLIIPVNLPTATPEP
jgi:LysM repeat protein